MEIDGYLEKYYANESKILHTIVDKILFKKGFGGIYDKDKDDFYSVANDVMCKIYKSYNKSKNFDAYVYACLSNKIKTEITKRNRNKRCCKEMINGNMTYKYPISIDTPIVDNSEYTIADTLISDFNIEDELSEEIGFSKDDKVEIYLNSLPEKARQVIIMKMNDVPVHVIKEKLDLTEREYSNYINRAKTNENIELFAKSTIYKEINNMCEIMPIDTTDNYRMDKHSLCVLLDEKRDGDINCKHILQRKPLQWTKKQKNKFLTRVLNNQPIPEIIICEQYVNGKKKGI